MYNRVRSQDHSSSIVTTTKNQVGTLFASSAFKTSGPVESMVDFVIPGYKQKIVDGFEPVYDMTAGTTLSSAVRNGYAEKYRELRRFIPPMNPLNYTCATTEEPLGANRFHSVVPTSYLEIKGCVTQALSPRVGVWPNPSVSIPDIGLAVAVAKSKLLIRTSNPKHAFGEPLAEVKQTLALIRSPLKQTARLLRSFSRKVENKAARTSKQQALAIAGSWAEVNWAIAPLVRTTDEALQTMADHLYRRYHDGYQTANIKGELAGFASSVSAESTFNFPHAGWTGFAWRYRKNVNKNIRYEYSVGIKYYHDDNDSIPTLLGLRGRDIPTVLWEVFPLSFMIDRMYNFKGCLQAASNFLSSSVRFTGGWVSVRQTTTVTKWLDKLNQNGAPTPYVTPAYTNPWFATDFVYTRSHWTPNIRDAVIPRSAGNLVSSLTKTADLAAVTAIKANQFAPFFSEQWRKLRKLTNFASSVR